MTPTKTNAPYGSWPSPLSPNDLARDTRTLERTRIVGRDEVWWSELRHTEGGRSAVCRHADGRHAEVVLPAPWDARSRVHEYGGGAWVADADRTLVFVEYTDQRVYRLDAGSQAPIALTPPSREHRHGDLTFAPDRRSVWCVRETHGVDTRREIVTIPLDGTAAAAPERITVAVSGTRFLAYPRVSPSRRSLAWIAWDHPQMPWDGTELRVARLDEAGRCGRVRTLLGSVVESVLQPEWASDESLYAISDRSGWWNIYRVDLAGADPVALCPLDADFGGALWTLGLCWYALLPDDRLLTVRTHGVNTLGVLDIRSGSLTDLDLGARTTVALGGATEHAAVLLCSGARQAPSIATLDLATGVVGPLNVGVSTTEVRDPAYLSPGRQMTFAREDGVAVHAVIYPPYSPAFDGPAGELPPYVLWIHGGPTSHVQPRVELSIALLTSRGIGVADVNYGGSTGYGRAYRQRLAGKWGVVDVEDAVAVAEGLIRARLADPRRLAIAGGSAGGWTALAALSTTDRFACGVSFFGVTDARLLAAGTHDFEARYLDGLIGHLPEDEALYVERAPISNIGRLSAPVLLLHGLADRVVPPEHARRFRDALIDHRVPHALIEFDGEGHGFRRADTLVQWRSAELSFYGQVMGFVPDGVPTLDLWRP